jgi:hypothetical protein
MFTKLSYPLSLVFMSILLVFVGTPLTSQSGPQPESVSETIELKVFPNPTRGEFNLEFELETNHPVVVRIFDLTGKEVRDLTNDLEKTGSNYSARVTLNNPTPGIHFIRVESAKQKIIKKLIIR